MTLTIDCIYEDPRWEKTNLTALAQKGAQVIAHMLDLSDQDYEACVMGCDDTRIAQLNHDFRTKDAATNVLSWPTVQMHPDAPGTHPPLPPMPDLGDIAISYDTCAQEATAANRPFEHHVTHLLIHGLLHLLGYDHINDADAELMEMTETKILAILGIPDPYLTET